MPPYLTKVLVDDVIRAGNRSLLKGLIIVMLVVHLLRAVAMAFRSYLMKWLGTRVLYEGEHESIREAVEAAVRATADLSRADLSRANLSGADLYGAKIAAGTLSAICATGWVLAYRWTAYQMEDGTTRLRYGCEEHEIGEWPGLLRGLCEEHEPTRADEYERKLRALLAYVAAIAEGE